METTTLHPKIQELRKKEALISYKQTEELKLSDENERVLKGYLAVFGNKDLSGEKFVKGSFAKSIKDRGPESSAKAKILFLAYHKQHQPLAKFSVLKEDNYGLYFESMPLDDVPWANEVLTQVKSGTLNQLSVGFRPVWDKAFYDESDDSIVFGEAQLFEGSVVSIGDNPETHFTKSVEELNNLFEETENLVNSLPIQSQIEARKLFQKYLTLSNTEPLESFKKALKEEKPSQVEEKPNIDYKYLITNY